MPCRTDRPLTARRARLISAAACIALVSACSKTTATTPTRETKTVPAGSTGAAVARAVHCSDITTPAENPPSPVSPTSSAACHLTGTGELEIYAWHSRDDEGQFETAIRQSENIGGDVDTYIVSGPQWDITIDEQLQPGDARRDAQTMQRAVGGHVEHVVSS